jgi:hypothetical protein
VFTTARHSFLYHFFNIAINIALHLRLGLPSGRFLHVSDKNSVWISHLSPVRDTRHTYLILSDLTKSSSTNYDPPNLSKLYVNK